MRFLRMVQGKKQLVMKLDPYDGFSDAIVGDSSHIIKLEAFVSIKII